GSNPGGPITLSLSHSEDVCWFVCHYRATLEANVTTVKVKSVARGVAILGALGLAPSLQAQTGIGTWVKKSEASAPGAMTMTIEACCHGGRRVIYHLVGTETVMTTESPFNGS